MKDKIIHSSIGFGYLILATSLKCYIYSLLNLNTPAIIDISKEGRMVCVCQGVSCFLVIETTGILVYNYDGRLVSSIKAQTLKYEFLNPNQISISPDVIVIRDTANDRGIKFSINISTMFF